MKIVVNNETVIFKDCLYTRIQYHNQTYEWINEVTEEIVEDNDELENTYQEEIGKYIDGW